MDSSLVAKTVFSSHLLIFGFIFSLLSLPLVFPGSLLAEEIQIVDGSGLTRAYRKIEPGSEVKIRVVVKEPSPSVQSELVLSQVDGTSGALQPQRESNSVLIFSGVTGGVWKIESKSGKAILEKVKILSK